MTVPFMRRFLAPFPVGTFPRSDPSLLARTGRFAKEANRVDVDSRKVLALVTDRRQAILPGAELERLWRLERAAVNPEFPALRGDVDGQRNLVPFAGFAQEWGLKKLSLALPVPLKGEEFALGYAPDRSVASGAIPVSHISQR